jgi:hypothetical protein
VTNPAGPFACGRIEKAQAFATGGKKARQNTSLYIILIKLGIIGRGERI